MQAGWSHLQGLILENKRGKHRMKSCILLWVQGDFCSSVDLGTNSLPFSITPFLVCTNTSVLDSAVQLTKKDRNSHVNIFQYSTENHLSFHLHLPLDENYADIPTRLKKPHKLFFLQKTILNSSIISISYKTGPTSTGTLSTERVKTGRKKKIFLFSASHSGI